ncbi:protein rep [uncultured Psychrobacter sp.]|uniref:protein rep n=1 Tax=uncultured Psychrobacter sp. TaxID=259303 RepID=UPI0026352A6C|nr:protein rep [uncultured Psychrobacter sp.]
MNLSNSTPFNPPFSSSSDSALGILTKSASMPDFKGLRANAVRRAEKYALQNEAVRLLPAERVRFCLKHRIDKSEAVTVRFNERTSQAHYSNVQRCGSVWLCPVCAAQISEGRRQELKTGMARWTGFRNNGAVYLLTLTNPHHHGDNLKALLEGQKKALKYFWSDRKPKEKFKTLGKAGHIISTEVTHGKNGWHPHYHVLLFFKKEIDIKALSRFLAPVWQNCCKKSGLKLPSLQNGLDIREGKYADKYVSKWGLADEVTKGHIKQGRNGSLTPWDLLRLSEDGCEKSGALFKTFATAFKGKRQLSWSRGLKDLLLVEEVTDESLATETEKDSIEVRKIALEIWRLIKRYKVRSDFLRAVEMDMIDGCSRADDLVMDIAQKYVTDNIHELMKDADLHHVRYQALNL